MKTNGQTRRYLLRRSKPRGRIRAGRDTTCPGYPEYRKPAQPYDHLCGDHFKMNKAKLPTHIEISTRDYNIVKNSVILLEQIRTIDKQRLKEYVCHIDSAMMKKVDEAICVSLNLPT